MTCRLAKRSFCHAILLFFGFFVTGFVFSKFTALDQKKCLFLPFVFNEFTALGFSLETDTKSPRNSHAVSLDI